MYLVAVFILMMLQLSQWSGLCQSSF